MLSRFTYTPSLDNAAFCDLCSNLVPVTFCSDCDEFHCDYCWNAYGCEDC